MKKRVCALLLVTVMLLSLAACGGSASSGIQTSSGSASNKSDSEEPVTITYYTWETAEENNSVWQEIEDKLNIRVEVCILPDTGGTDKESALDIVAMSGSEMDFRIITETSPAQRIENGFAYNLDELIDRFDVDMEGLFGKYAEFVQYDGSYYGIPCRANVKYWFYNKDIFDELGLEYPQDGWTWDEYFALADQITEMSDYYGTSTNAHTGMWSYNGLMQGGQTFDEDGNFIMYDDPYLLDAMYQYKRMDDEGVKPSFVSMRSRNSYISTEFLSGNCAMAEGFPYILRDMRLPDQFPFDFEVGVVTPPVNEPGDTCYTCGGVQFLAINPGSEHKEEAFQAMVYYMEHGAEYMVNLSVPPVAEASDELIEAFVEGTPVSVEDGAKFFDTNVQFVKSNPYEDYPNGVDYQSIMNEEAEVYFTNGQDFDTSVENIRTRSEELVASAAAE